MAFADVLHRLGQLIGLYSADDEQYEDEEEFSEEFDEEEEEDVQVSAGNGGRGAPIRKSRERPATSSNTVRNNVVQMPARDGREAPAAVTTRHSATIMYVRRKEDGQQIISYVLEGRSVILNCEEIDDAQCQRVIDILSGAAFALGGRIQRISHRNYLFVPASVDIVNGEPARYSETRR